MTSKIGRQAIKLASEILAQPEFADLKPLVPQCGATEQEKRADICFLPRERARPERCSYCKFYRR